MMTKLYADRLADEPINVYEIRPGIIKTPLTEIVSDKYDRLIAEDYFPFSTGHVYNIDGGFHIHRL